MKRTETDRGQYDTPEDVFWASGACLLVRSSVYKRLGGLDNRFFAHMEEIDLCWRMQLEGWKVTTVPQSVVYHVGGGTLPATSPFKLFLNYRNNLLMLDNNLAKTFALEQYKCGKTFRKAASRGCRRARRRIFTRRCLDWLSAIVYIVTFRFAYAKAVFKAHSEFRKMARGTDRNAVTLYLQNWCMDAQVKGMYRKWIVLHSILKGDNIFNFIIEDDFYKI